MYTSIDSPCITLSSHHIIQVNCIQSQQKRTIWHFIHSTNNRTVCAHSLPIQHADIQHQHLEADSLQPVLSAVFLRYVFHHNIISMSNTFVALIYTVHLHLWYETPSKISQAQHEKYKSGFTPAGMQYRNQSNRYIKRFP